MADDGPVPMDLVNVGAHDARTTQSDQGAIRGRRHKMKWAMLVPRRGTSFLGLPREQREVHSSISLGTTELTLRSDHEPSIEALARKLAQARHEGSQTVPEKDLQWRAPRTDGGNRGWSGQNTESCTGASYLLQRPA